MSSQPSLRCLLWAEDSREWDLRGTPPHWWPTLAYVRSVLVELGSHLDDGWTVVVTSHPSGRPPATGPRTIVWCLGEEFAYRPAYDGEVALICKPFGIRWPLTRPWEPLPVSGLLHDLLISGQRLTRRARAVRNGSTRRPPVLHVPIGPQRRRAIEWVPFEQRAHDVSFRGSLVNAASDVSGFVHWHPKNASRRDATGSLQTLAVRRPDLDIDLRVYQFYRDAAASDPAEYLRSLMDSRVVLCPRGNGLETARHYEALGSGCVVVTDRVPPGPLRSAPLVRVRSWRTLATTLEPLLADTARLQRLHLASLRWWNETAAPSAVAESIARSVAAATDGE